MSQDLLQSFDAGIATLTMNRPQTRTALTRDMLATLAVPCPAWRWTRRCAWWC